MKKLPYLEILIIICTCILIWTLAYPQYKENNEKAKRYKVLSNMYNLRLAVENYAAFNNGKLPKTLKDIEKFLPTTINPYTRKKIELQDIIIFNYSSEEEIKDFSPNSRNGRIHGNKGALAYGYYIPKDDSLPIAYGILGLDEFGKPLMKKHISGKNEIVVIYE